VKSRGFTLLEVILALIVLSTIALAVFGSLRVVFTARDSATAALRESREMSATATLIRTDLEAAVAPGNEMFSQFIGGDEAVASAVGGGTAMTISASFGGGGEADSLLFQSSSGAADIRFDHTTVETLGELTIGGDSELDPQPVAADVHEIEYTRAADATNPDQTNLVRRVRKNLLAETAEEPVEQVILRNVASFDLRFFDGTTWTESWDSTTLDNAMPLAVEMVLETAAAPPQRLVQVYRLSMATPSQEGVRITR